MNDKYDNYSRDDFKYALDNYDYAIAELEEEQMKLASENDFLKSERDNLERSLEEAGDRITELEERLEEVEGQYAYECGCNKQLVELQEEKLNNAIVPKFKVGQEVWFILKDNKGVDVFSGTVRLITLNGYYQPPKLIYTIIQFDREWRCEEKSLFATEAEAQKYLEERK